MSDQKSATPDIDTQIESLLEPVFKLGYEHSDKDYAELTKAIKALLIQSKIDELKKVAMSHPEQLDHYLKARISELKEKQ